MPEAVTPDLRGEVLQLCGPLGEPRGPVHPPEALRHHASPLVRIAEQSLVTFEQPGGKAALNQPREFGVVL